MEKFSEEVNGYSKKEVNKFLEEVITQVETVLTRIQAQEKEIELLRREVSHYHQIEQTLNKAIFNAEETSNNIRRMAKQESNLIVDDAKKNANRIVNEALLRAEKIEMQNDLVERNLRIFKSKLKRVVEQQLEVVEEIELLEIN